jgi:hypothetical protein
MGKAAGSLSTEKGRYSLLQSLDSCVTWSVCTGAGHYAAASSYLDGTAEACQASGLPSTSVQFGPFAETGMAAEHAQALSSLGLLSLRPHEVGPSLAAHI